jgi:hypothetical protein
MNTLPQRDGDAKKKNEHLATKARRHQEEKMNTLPQRHGDTKKKKR